MYNNFNPYGNPYFNSMPTGTQPYGVPMNSYNGMGNMGTPNFNSQPNFQNPTPNQNAQPQNQPFTMPQQVNTNKLYVTGIDDARNKQLPPNSDYVFLDNDKPLLYRKVVDATGKMEVQAFEIVPYTEKPAEPVPQVDMSQYVSVDDFNALKGDLERVKDYINKSIQKQQSQANKAQSPQSNEVQKATSI